MNIDANTVTIVKESELYSREFVAGNFNWINGEPSKPVNCTVQTRYHAKEVKAAVSPLGSGRVLIRTETPLRAVVKGQSAVIYDEETVLGGGEIIDVT